MTSILGQTGSSTCTSLVIQWAPTGSKLVQWPRLKPTLVQRYGKNKWEWKLSLKIMTSLGRVIVSKISSFLDFPLLLSFSASPSTKSKSKPWQTSIESLLEIWLDIWISWRMWISSLLIQLLPKLTCPLWSKIMQFRQKSSRLWKSCWLTSNG